MTEKEATMVDVQRAIRRKLRKRHEEEETSLNIYPMMDMMTILLVFMIQQFASSSANIVQSEELQIPFSKSKAEMQEALPVQISSSEIVVEGKHVLRLRNGQVDPSNKQGGGNGFLVTPLLSAMQQRRDELKLIAARIPSRPFTGEVQVIADKHIPYRTLIEVIYTMGQAEFSSVRFVVLKKTSG